jgi:hypothetical protein
MTELKRSSRRPGAPPDGDQRDPEYRPRFIFGDESRNAKYRSTLLGDFLFFGALLRR